jgi:hypothetical protein
MERSVTYVAPRNSDPLASQDVAERVVAALTEKVVLRQGWSALFPAAYVAAQYEAHRDAIGMILWGALTGALFFSVALGAWVAWVLI